MIATQSEIVEPPVGSVPSVVRLTRRVTFSSGHRYWLTDLTPEENRAVFGRWASPYNHGHNYALEVTIAGTVDPVNGMVVNIKRVDDVLKERILAEFDQKSINDEVEHFRNRAPSIENLLTYFASALPEPIRALPGSPSVEGIRLFETATLYGEWNADPRKPMLTLTRTYEFAASHRLHSEALSAEENVALYGKCNNRAGHGHNYVLEVTVAGDVDPTTGMMVDLGRLDAVVNDRVVERYDHRNLDVDLPEFAGRVTTSEVVVQEIWRALDGHLPARLERVRLYETARNLFEVSRS
ncbi:MAG: 6-carboxytetrahydropterin synthase [Fimbriimonadaceae bacterium]